MNRIILHIDMNSYFATVEQQANPLLRGKPIAVSGRPNIHSVVATASYEAKKYGVTAGMSTWEAKKLCPGLIFIPGDPNKYIDLTGRLIKIFKSYSPIIEVFSIDEVFLDVTQSLSSYWQGPMLHRTASRIAEDVDFHGLTTNLHGCQIDSGVLTPFVPRMTENATEMATYIALEIKSRIKKEIGDKMTCSIGIASNKFLAKLASEKKKPDGLTVINENNLDEMLLSSKLEDFCGIGRRIFKRLNDIGITTVLQLQKIPVDTLTSAFGNICGHHLHDMAFGIDDSPVIADFESPEQKSFSHSLTLDQATDDRHYVEAVMLRLCEKVGRRLREENFAGNLVCLYVRYPDMDGISEQKLLSYYTDDGGEIFEVGKQILDQHCHPCAGRDLINGYSINVSDNANWIPAFAGMTDVKLPFKVRMLNIGVGGLVKKDVLTASLLPEKQRAEKIVTSMDFVNNRFGENSVFRAATLSAFDREKSVAGIRTRLRFQ